MKKLLSLSFALSAILSNLVYADSTGTIYRVVCHESEISPVCQVAMNDTPSVAACATSGWHYTFDGTTAEGKNILSILLTAQISKQPITIGGKGICTLGGGSEDLRHAFITTSS